MAIIGHEEMPFTRAASGPVIVCAQTGQVMLVKKETEKKWGFSGGRVPSCKTRCENYNHLLDWAIRKHNKNTGANISRADFQQLNGSPYLLDYVEERNGKNVRLIHFLFQVEDAWKFMESANKSKAKHPQFRFFSPEEIMEMAKREETLPNVPPVINLLTKK